MSLEKIEQNLEESPFILHAFVYSDSFKSHPVAVIIPNSQSFVKSNQEKVATNDDIETAIGEEIKRLSKVHELRPFETPANFFHVDFETKEWTIENKLLLVNNKKNTKELQKKYDEVIKKLYTKAAIMKNLKTDSFNDDSTLAEIGGDSLTAIRFFLCFLKNSCNFF